MTDIELEELKAGLEGVTPGPWYQTGAPWFRSGDGVLAGSPDGNIAFLIADLEPFAVSRDEYEGPFPLGDAEKDAAHIARCHPEAIRSLIARVEEAEGLLLDLRAHIVATADDLSMHSRAALLSDRVQAHFAPPSPPES